jgi:hypothetical protein
MQVQIFNHRLRITAFLISLTSLAPSALHAVNTVYFNTSDVGVTKSITDWGVDTSWPSADNMRQSIMHMGAGQIDVVRVNFFMDEPLQPNGEIGPSSKSRINTQLNLAAMAGNKPLVVIPATEKGSNAWYLNGFEVRVDRWVQLIEATQRYINRPIAAVEPFNEPDYWPGQGTPENLRDIMVQLQSSPYFPGVALLGGSTLSSFNAQYWYDNVSGPVTHGTTHQLSGSAVSYVDFIQYVKANGDVPYNPEIHSLAEAIYGAEYGLEGGAWWGPVLLARGHFVKDNQGQRLGYAENLNNRTAAAVYRAPNGQLRAFAGGFERQGAVTNFRYVSTDRDVYFNGVGPLREFMVPVTMAEDAYVDIDLDAPISPAFDGNRWKIVNRQTGLSLEVAGGGLNDFASIQGATDIGALYQRWDIIRDKDGYLRLFNANSQRTAEVADWSQADGAQVRQWGVGDGLAHKWFLEEAQGGYYYIRNGLSNKYLTGSVAMSQWSLTGSNNQQWQLVRVAPTGSQIARYKLDGSTAGVSGINNATASGAPTFMNGRLGQAINLDGIDDYVTLPSGVASSKDITVSAWVKWNGGNAWQRIFDFGNDMSSYMFLTPSSADNTLRFAITTSGNANEQMLDTAPLPIGQWTHLALTLSGNTGVLYVDGAPRVAGIIPLNPSDINSTFNYIGKSQWPDPFFSGMIDDFRIYNYALDQSQIASLYHNFGDFNNDGKVDAADYATWRKEPNPPAASFNIWRQNFGNSISAAGLATGETSVPEPNATFLGVLLVVTAYRFKRHAGIHRTSLDSRP